MKRSRLINSKRPLKLVEMNYYASSQNIRHSGLFDSDLMLKLAILDGRNFNMNKKLALFKNPIQGWKGYF